MIGLNNTGIQISTTGGDKTRSPRVQLTDPFANASLSKPWRERIIIIIAPKQRWAQFERCIIARLEQSFVAI